jgi:hypothetical protein
LFPFAYFAYADILPLILTIAVIVIDLVFGQFIVREILKQMNCDTAAINFGKWKTALGCAIIILGGFIDRGYGLLNINIMNYGVIQICLLGYLLLAILSIVGKFNHLRT